jgi:phage-related protein
MKEIAWLSSSKKDLMDFPEDVRREVGYALYVAQQGETHELAKIFKGMVVVFMRLSVTLIKAHLGLYISLI